MAYIPTIHTFEDDINENRDFDQAPISGGTERIITDNSILVPEEKTSGSLTKKLLTLISVIFILGTISALGYYFYNNYKIKQAEDLLNQKALAVKEASDQAQVGQNDLGQIFPTLAIGITPYIKTFTQKENLIILTIKENDQTSGIDNYSLLYAYILSHKKDLGRDLIRSFNLDKIASEIVPPESLNDNQDTNSIQKTESTASNTKKTSENSTSSSLQKVVNFFDPTNLQKELNKTINSFAPQVPLSADELIWERKSLNNQDFEISNAGVVTLIYGYVKNNNYVIFATSLKDFFDAVDSLQ